MLPTLNFTNARPNCDLDYVPNDFRDQKINLFMKNNYAFGGNNCSMIISMEPCSIPVSTYDESAWRSPAGCRFRDWSHRSRILDNVWQQNHTVELGGVTFPEDTLEEAKELLDVLETTRQFEALFGDDFNALAETLPEANEHFKTFRFPGWNRVNICAALTLARPRVAVRSH